MKTDSDWPADDDRDGRERDSRSSGDMAMLRAERRLRAATDAIVTTLASSAEATPDPRSLAKALSLDEREIQEVARRVAWLRAHVRRDAESDPRDEPLP